MVAFTAITPGDVLYQVLRQRMGNTTLTRDSVYTVRVLSIDGNWALCSWNGNPPRRWGPQEIAKLRRKKPEVEPSIFEKARAARAKAPRP